MTKHTLTAAVMAAVIGGTGLAQAEGDPAKGEKVFRRCQACHKVEDGKNGVGPHLYNVVGREVGAVEGYKYSSSMMEWGEGKVWDEANLRDYLADPRGVVKGTKMAFGGLKKDQQIADVIAYLEAESGGS